MKLHHIRIIESMQHSTARLFELGCSFGVCKQAGRWPSLATMNAFLLGGTDDGELGTDVEWDSIELTPAEYDEAIHELMGDLDWVIDETSGDWQVWFDALPRG